HILLLGAGTAADTSALVGADLHHYLDALAVTSSGPASAALKQLPLWLLPPLGANTCPPAVGLAQNAAVVTVSPPELDHGVTAHLLNDTVLFQPVRLVSTADAPIQFPFVAVFQGDGYAVAAIAGLSAGTDLDADLPGLARARTDVSPVTADDKPPNPNLEVSD